MDSFRVLGVSPDASPAEIKRAYRRLAMAWHPDRNPHPEATERFKQIRAAYDALQEREELDEEPEVPAEAAPQPPRAADIRLDLELSLEEAAFGCRKTIPLRRGTPCPTCAGSGEAGVSCSRLCQACHGSGRIRHRHHGLERCPQCDGRGFFSQRICPDCEGSGSEHAAVSLEVRVPEGMLPGDELRLSGQGEPGGDERMPGDLFLKVAILPHDLFRLEGRDIAYSMPLSILKLLAGGSMRVPVLGGFETLEVAAGDGGSRMVRLAGRGFPGRNGGPPGDLVISLTPVWPRHLDEHQRRLLQEADAALEKALPDHLPEIAAWQQRYGV